MDLVRRDVAAIGVRHARRRSRTASPSSRPRAAPPTACCISSRSPTSSDLHLDIDEFGAIADRTPIVADMQPGGRFTATDMYEAGGLGLVMRELLKRDGPPPRRRADRRRPDDRRDRRRRRRRPTASRWSSRSRRPLKPTGGLAILRGTPRTRRLRREAGRPRAAPPPRPGPGLRFRDRLLRGGQGPTDRAGRRRRDPLRGTGRWAGHAGDAQRHRRARRRGPRRHRRTDHRRPLLGRDARADARSHRAGGGARRPDRARRGGRRDRHRRRPQAPSTWSSPAEEIARRLAALDAAAPALHDRRAGEIRGAGRVGLAGRRHDRAADDRRTCGCRASPA